MTTPREIERVELWRCPECNRPYVNPAVACVGVNNDGQRCAGILAPVTFLKADDVAGEIERLAGDWEVGADDSGNSDALRNLFRQKAANLKALASDLREGGDGE